jgi:hypothetical protein
MALVVHYNLELHQMDVKMTSLNEDLLVNVYMTQPKGFAMEQKEHMGYHLRKFIYGLKQAFSQWYLKFDEIIRRFGFKKKRRTIAFMQSSGVRNLFSLSCMLITFYLLVVMSVCC